MHRTEAEAIATKTVTLLDDLADFLFDCEDGAQEFGNTEAQKQITALLVRIATLRRFIVRE